MSLFAELDAVDTPMGRLVLRRRFEPTRRVEVHEVKLGDEFLMSSLFTVAERELAHLGLAALPGDGPLEVAVGGLGLGYTALAALEDPRVTSLVVVDALAPVIDWHRRELLPDTVGLAADPRVRLVEADWFAVTRGEGYDPDAPGRRFDALLLDVDHSPVHHLAPSHAHLYTVAGLSELAAHLRPGGVFALWSDDPPDEGFLATLGEVFVDVAGHSVAFRNLIAGGTAVNGVYVARRPA